MPSRSLTNSSRIKCYLPLVTVSVQKIKNIDCFFPAILMIKESYNMTGQDGTLVANLESWVLNCGKIIFVY